MEQAHTTVKTAAALATAETGRHLADIADPISSTMATSALLWTNSLCSAASQHDHLGSSLESNDKWPLRPAAFTSCLA